MYLKAQMKTVYLIRHAKSDWQDVTLKDFDRPLNNRGHRVAPKMGQMLASKGINPELILSSPALRAKTTAIYLAEQLTYDPEKIHYVKRIYEASVRELLHVICAIDDQFDTAFLIGHNPAMSYLSEVLTGETIGNMPTCAIVAVEFELQSWEMVSPDTGVLKFFHFPKEFDF